jgi:5-(carboxyamino)imidazole ribonucleotide synthase
MTPPFLPGAKIGVMGGGQLGRMFAIAARRMGYRVHTFSPETDGPAAQLSDVNTVADYGDEAAVRKFVQQIDVLTFEFENIPAQTVNWCADRVPVRPSASVLHTAQHRLREKNFLSRNGFPVAGYREVNTRVDLDAALKDIGTPAILKTAGFGYDGKGQQFVDGSKAADELWADRPGDELVLEKAIEFEREISVIVARAPNGDMRTLPVSENIHRHHILDVTIVPARISDAVAKAAAELACDVTEKLDVIGLLGVEMFLKADGELLVNELAPRPHNSGHWSIEGCATSQFEQHVRAVCGLPLGSTELLRPTAMANLLGDVWNNGEPDWAAALQTPNAHLHLYGKRDPRPRRKMGHVTATVGSIDEAIAAVRSARAALNPESEN